MGSFLLLISYVNLEIVVRFNGGHGCFKILLVSVRMIGIGVMVLMLYYARREVGISLMSNVPIVLCIFRL